MGYANIEDKRAYHKAYMKERRLWLKQHHCCTECGKQDAYTLNGRSRCFNCNEKKNNTHGDKAKRNANEKNKRKQAEISGMCVRCFNRKADKGYKTCSHCRTKSRIYQQKNKSNIPRGERFSYGLCYKCGGGLDGQLKANGDKSHLCSSCYDKTKAPKIKNIYFPSSDSGAALNNWNCMLRKRKELLEAGVYDEIRIVGGDGKSW